LRNVSAKRRARLRSEGAAASIFIVFPIFHFPRAARPYVSSRGANPAAHALNRF
jgi:hypothetical protein